MNHVRIDWDMWADVADLTDSFNRRNGAGEHAVTLRVLKVAEEAGEAAGARIAQCDQNPGKPPGNEGKVIAELCDTLVAAMVSLTTITGDVAAAREHLAAKLAECVARTKETPPPEHTGGNAEDCPRRSGRRDLPYPFICPGTDPEETP